MVRIVALGCLLLLEAPPATAGEPRVDYLRDVKPILARKCYACHGGLRQRAGLRLDTAELIRKGSKGGPVVVAGHADESAIVDRVTAEGSERMPPEGEGEALGADERARLRAWIDQGAAAPESEVPQVDPRRHWAFLRPTRHPIPELGSSRNPIDAFLAAEYRKRGLTPAPAADKEILLRRVSLDLIGLPPTRQERLDFLADEAPDAYERLVDRLLASPRYGERWGRHWMDVWRYSDWYGKRDIGQHRNSRMHIWRWRDWIIESLNADKPYDRMILEMIAGDELAPGDEDVHRATGYLGRNYYVYNRNVWMQDVVEYSSMGFLGLTFKCCRCHDHKYDPIAQADYYRLRAFFEPYDVRLDRLPGKPETFKVTNPAGTAQIEVLKEGLERVFDADPKARTYLLRKGDEKNPDKETVILPGLPPVLGRSDPVVEPVELPLEVFYPDMRPALREERLGQAREALAAAVVAFEKARAEVESSSPQPACTGEAGGGGAVAASVKRAESVLSSRQAALAALDARTAAELARYATPPAPAKDLETLARAASKAERMLAMRQAEEAALQFETALTDARRALKPGDAKTKDALASAEKARSDALTKLGAARKALGESSSAYSPFGPVYPRTSTGRRLALARWVASRDNALTARVAVNHIWLRHFGSPLVPSVFNFGLNGKPPTHPELLDWLAVEFMDRGWSTKALHRLIVTSDAYRMRSSASGPSDLNRAIDNENQYLWRSNPRRIEAEVVRDSLLSLAGLLDTTMGGPDIAPELGDTVPRRSVYFRHTPDDMPMLVQVFDPANPVECYRRDESVVPQQALALANGPLSQSLARLIVRGLVKPLGAQGPDGDAAFVTSAFLHVLSRPPSDRERARCLAFLKEQTSLFDDPAKLSAFTVGPKSSVRPASTPKLRAWENLVHVLLNHNDFVTLH